MTFTGNDGEIRTAGGINSGSVTMSASGTLFWNCKFLLGGTTLQDPYCRANDAGTGAITMTGGKFYTTMLQHTT